MTIPTEPIGSIPRPLRLIEAVATRDGTDPALDPLYAEAIRDTIERFEATGSPVITDGEQRKYHNFWTYCVHGLPNTAPDGFKIPFAAGHTRRMLRLTGGPFRYKRHADSYLDVALGYAHVPVKQAVISPSALSLMYPPDEIPGYPREQFIDDLLREHETEVRACLRKGAHKVQIDFTEGRLAVKIDPSGNLLHSFIDLNNLALSRFSAEDRKRIGVHTCPGGDRDSTHSADVDYAELLPSLFELMAGNFYIALAGERDRVRVLKIIRDHMKADQRVFVGVVAPIDPRVETPEEVRDRVLEAAQYIPVGQLGTTDDCGFSPFCDDTSTTRDMAFEKIRARVQGTALAAEILGGSLMATKDDEERLLRSVALQNAESILFARRHAEEKLRESEERYRALFALVPVAVYSCDPSGVIQEFNRRAGELWDREPALGDTDERFCGSFKLFRPDGSFIPHEQSPMAEVLSGKIGEARDAEALIERPDGSRITVVVNIRPLKNQRGEVTGAINCFYDITERKRAEEALRQVAAELSEADRRKNEFLAMLAHELRNPLAPIRNALQVMRLTDADGQAVRSASEMMERQVGQMVRLVDDLLDVSRISRGKIELRKGRIELASSVNHAVEAIRPQCNSRDHALTVTLPPQPIYLNADPTRLAQVVGNLLNNACKFTNNRGRIWLTVEREDGQAVIRVRDTGIGIAADELPRIFEMFTQVDTSLERTHSGLGIGLTLVRELVEMHGGTVEAHSAAIGQGSEFVVRLPILVETPKPPPPEPAVSEPTPTTPRRILVVDDNRDSAESMAMLLDLTGNETHTAYDGLEAVEAAATFKPDAVLLDIGLPRMNGYEAARKIREQPWGKKMVLVALTGWGQDEDRRKSQEAGFDHHMVKPVDYAALTKLLAELGAG